MPGFLNYIECISYLCYSVFILILGYIMQKLELQVQPRTVTGRKVKTLRKEHLLPGVIYGLNSEPKNIQIQMKDFKKIYGEAGESTMIYVLLDGEEYPAMIQDVTRNAVSDDFIHVDLYKVRLDKEITAKVPLNFVGQPAAVKDLGGILVKNINEIEVQGFPQDIPRSIEVDISGLNAFGSHILLKDVKISDKVKIKDNPDEIVVLIQEPISEEALKKELETTTAAPEEVEVIKKVKEEGEEGAEAEADAKPQEDKKEAKKETKKEAK
ncbi:MAG: large subunit ribosomal protein L25 [Parcubacteria group bacterium Licking1014_17]|nr:MAG: large subunit ribosomal protein L25 [Parcubacteria group bacterium Licking1014_17]